MTYLKPDLQQLSACSCSLNHIPVSLLKSGQILIRTIWEKKCLCMRPFLNSWIEWPWMNEGPWWFLDMPCLLLHICILKIINVKVILLPGMFFTECLLPIWDNSMHHKHPWHLSVLEAHSRCHLTHKVQMWVVTKASPVRRQRRLGSLNIKISVALRPSSFSQIWCQKSS